MTRKADRSPAEVEMLKSGDTYYPSKEEDQLLDASMDNVDFDGEPLNEKGFGIATSTSSDRDVRSAEEDDE